MKTIILRAVINYCYRLQAKLTRENAFVQIKTDALFFTEDKELILNALRDMKSLGIKNGNDMRKLKKLIRMSTWAFYELKLMN
jgi:hypothetical protein